MSSYTDETLIASVAFYFIFIMIICIAVKNIFIISIHVFWKLIDLYIFPLIITNGLFHTGIVWRRNDGIFIT